MIVHVHRRLCIPSGYAPMADALVMYHSQPTVPPRNSEPLGTTHSASPRIQTPRRHRPKDHQRPSCIVVCALLDARLHAYRSHIAPFRRRVRRYPASCASDPGAPNPPFQSEDKLDDPNHGRNHPPKASAAAVRPSIAIPPTPPLLEPTDFVPRAAAVVLCRGATKPV